MTPHQYIRRLETLLAAERHQDALDFSVSAGPYVQPELTLEELERVYSMMEDCATIVALDQAAARPHKPVAEPVAGAQSARRTD